MTHGTYDPVLVAVSVAIAAFASYTALDLANRVSVNRGWSRAIWLTGGSVAMGVGIWSMHFVGMLAFRMPGMTVSYDVPLLILSVVVAIAASAIALAVVTRNSVPRISLLFAGLVMGAAICGMHYIGIAGMNMSASVTWNPSLVWASILIAVGAAYAALWLALRFRREHAGRWLQVLAAIIMGVAISGMHYTAMAAMRFTPRALPTNPADDLLASDALALAVTLSTLLILGIALASSAVQRALERQGSLAEQNAKRFRDADRRATEEEALRHATEALASAFNIHDVLEQVARSAIEATAADGALIESGSGTTATIEVALGHAVPPARSQCPYESSLTARVQGRREPLVLERDEVPPESAAPGAQSFVVVPIIEDSTKTAALVLVRMASRPAFRPDEVSRAATVAHLATMAIRRVRLLEEADRRREELALAERLAGLGRLASRIAHEFNNVLMSIQAFHEVTQRVGTYEQYAATAPQIERAIQRGKTITDAVLTVTRATQPALRPVDVARWLRSLQSDLRSLLGPAISVVTNCTARSAIRADPNHLEQAFVNLAINARDAMRDGGVLTISADDEIENDNAVVHFVIRDSGTGMNADTMRRIFEPLYTTKRGGTGLGLAIVHEIVRAHDGSISVESEPGAGTAFHIRLKTTAVGETGPMPLNSETACRARRLLLVEDDEIVGQGLVMILELAGFTVRHVSLGREAVPVMREFQPDVIVLDVGLPDIDGVTVYDLIQQEAPGKPTVFATGHADETLLAGIVGLPHVGFVRKPFESAVLLTAIETVTALRPA